MHGTAGAATGAPLPFGIHWGGSQMITQARPVLVPLAVMGLHR